MTTLANPEYVVTGACIAGYFALKLNVFPKISSRIRPRRVLLILLCGLASLNLYAYYKIVKAGFGPDPVAATESSLEEVRRMLPPADRVGFITDDSPGAQRRHFLTQYSVAPIVVEKGTSPDWVIVNKFDPQLIPSDLVLVRDFGQGIMLFRKRDK